MPRGSNELLLGFFFYGLSYVFLGALLIFQPRREERRDLSESLWFLGLFAVLHGLDEWTGMVNVMRSWSPAVETGLRRGSDVLNTLAMTSLLQFAVNLLAQGRPNLEWLRRVPAVALAAWGVLLALGATLGTSIRPLGLEEDTLRYGLGLGAAVLACYAILGFHPVDLSPSVRKLLLVCTVFFAINALLSLMTASRASFSDLFGLDGEVSGATVTLVVFRALCAMAVAVTLVYALIRLDLDQNEVLQRQRDELAQAHARLAASFEELRKTQRQLVQSERMSAIGTLVGGIAHEYNNILAGVKGFTQLARMGDDLEQVHRDLDVVEASADRAIELTRRLQSWVRTDARPRHPIDGNDVVRQAVALAQSTLSREDVGVTVEMTLGDTPPVFISRAELQDILLNLLVNAGHAIGRCKGRPGRIRVSTTRQDAFVVLEVADNGCGIPPGDLDRVFLPFFTTKGSLGTSETEGRGLGLYSVYGIVQARGGDVKVESTLGEGTTFQVLLPTAPPRPAPRLEATEDAGASAQDAPACLRILVVGDETAVRAAAARFLEKGGSKVLEARSGDEAIHVARGQPFDLVLLDITAPGYGELGTLDALRRDEPDLPVALMTGPVSAELREQLFHRGAARLVSKPFDAGELLDVVRRVAVARAPGDPPAAPGPAT